MDKERREMAVGWQQKQLLFYQIQSWLYLCTHLLQGNCACWHKTYIYLCFQTIHKIYNLLIWNITKPKIVGKSGIENITHDHTFHIFQHILHCFCKFHSVPLQPPLQQMLGSGASNTCNPKTILCLLEECKGDCQGSAQMFCPRLLTVAYFQGGHVLICYLSIKCHTALDNRNAKFRSE